MLLLLTRVWLLRRFFAPPPRRRTSYGSPHHSPVARRPRGYGRRRRREGFGMFGPFPRYSRTTRGGGRVSVGGCCLPIPLAIALGSIAAARGAVRRRS